MDGTAILEALIKALQDQEIAYRRRYHIYLQLLPAFESCLGDEALTSDCLYQDAAFDTAVRQLHPEWYQTDEEEE